MLAFQAIVLFPQGIDPISLRKVAAALAERGYVSASGKPYVPSAVASMLGDVA